MGSPWAEPRTQPAGLTLTSLPTTRAPSQAGSLWHTENRRGSGRKARPGAPAQGRPRARQAVLTSRSNRPGPRRPGRCTRPRKGRLSSWTASSDPRNPVPAKARQKETGGLSSVSPWPADKEEGLRPDYGARVLRAGATRTICSAPRGTHTLPGTAFPPPQAPAGLTEQPRRKQDSLNASLPPPAAGARGATNPISSFAGSHRELLVSRGRAGTRVSGPQAHTVSPPPLRSHNGTTPTQRGLGGGGTVGSASDREPVLGPPGNGQTSCTRGWVPAHSCRQGRAPGGKATRLTLGESVLEELREGGGVCASPPSP